MTGGLSGKLEQNVYTAALNEWIVSSFLIEAGRIFQSLGPTTAKELS